MKRVFEHPAEELTGKRYWRSLGELSDTPEFRGWLEREFPAGSAQPRFTRSCVQARPGTRSPRRSGTS